MLSEVIAFLRCPSCGERVVAGGGDLVCPAGHTMPVRNGYIDAGAVDDPALAPTLESFGYEWSMFDAIRAEDEQFWRMYFRDVPVDRLQHRIGLDAGCGKARYSRLTAPHLRALVALDGSGAVEAAARNLADVANAIVIKADLRDPPVAPASFGFVSCLGVLHHLPDPEAGFRALGNLLAPDGIMLLYMYSRPESPGIRAAGLWAATLLRKATVRLPHRLLRLLCAPLAAVLYGLLVVPGQYGARLRIPALGQLPLQVYRGQPVRSLWLDTFDRLSAPIENRYRWSDLAPWFRRAGLVVDAVREEAGLFIVCHRPTPSDLAVPSLLPESDHDLAQAQDSEDRDHP